MTAAMTEFVDPFNADTTEEMLEQALSIVTAQHPRGIRRGDTGPLETAAASLYGLGVAS